MADVNIPNTSPTYKHWNIGDNWTVDRNWTWHETYHWELQVNEIMEVSDRVKKDPSLAKREAFKMVDRRKSDYSATKRETLNLKDKIGFASRFNLKLSEAWKTTDKHANMPMLPFSEAFSAFDALLRPAQGVISDMLFEEGTWDLDKIKTYMFKGKHVGYENFKPFIAGDYTYDKALFRTTIDVTSADRGLIEQWQLVVDVPDITDRGSAEVVDANFVLKVDFNRTFHIAPEVVCTVRSGSSSVPITVNITEITEKNFKVQLVNAVTGKPTTGRFIWSATGY